MILLSAGRKSLAGGSLGLAFADFGQDEITIYLNTTTPTTVPLLTPTFLFALASMHVAVGAMRVRPTTQNFANT